MKKLILLLVLFVACSYNLSFGEMAILTSKGKELAQGQVKKVLIYYNAQYMSSRPSLDYIHWLLYDPLILSEANIELTVVRQVKSEASYPDLSNKMISLYDLVIVPYPHHINPEYISDLKGYLDGGGALFLVKPAFESHAHASLLLGKMGVSFKGLEDKTPSYSLLSDHISTRILGLSSGRSVYPHRMYEPYMKFEIENGIVLTHLSYNGDPDLFLTSNGKFAIVATDIFNDLDKSIGHIEYPDYKKNIGYLFINTVRSLLDLDFFIQPVQMPQQRWSDFFYAYAVGREYVLNAREEEPFSSRLSKDELKLILEEADLGITQAAKASLKGNFEECKILYDKSVKLLSESMDKMTQVDRYLIRGWHSSILTPDYYGGGLRGYAEAEWQDLLVQWMKMQVDWITPTGSKRVIDVYPNDWEVLDKYYPEDVQLFKEGVSDGRLEAVHGIYTAAYLPILSEESNIRQFSYGLKGFEKVLDTKVETFLCPRDHFDFHPQLPQILNSYGYKYAILRGNHKQGEIKPIYADKIRWSGLDGSQIEAVPNYEGTKEVDIQKWIPLPASIAKADQLGYKAVLFGSAHDATTALLGEKEHTLINPIAPIVGTWVTAKEFFERTPKAEQSFFLGVDDLYARYLEEWTSLGCINEVYEWNRSTENKILAAEKFNVVAAVLSEPNQNSRNSQKNLDESWKNLFRTQDHLTFGPVDYTNQIPSDTLKPGEEKEGLYSWGYDFDLLPPSLKTVGNVENWLESHILNYAGPRVPGSRYEVVKKFIKESQNISTTVLNEALGSISGGNKAQHEKNSMIPMLVFNQLGWSKNDIVTVEKEFREGEIFHFVMSDGNKEIPYQVTTIEKYGDNSLKKIKVFFLAEIPSMGYKTYFLKPVTKEPAMVTSSSLKGSSTRLENDYYIVEINAEHGGISRIFDKKLGLEMLSSKEIGNELFSPADPVASSIKNKAKIELTEKGPLRVTTVVKSRIGEAYYECAISLNKDLKRIDFNLTVDYGKAGLNFGTFEKDETGLFVRFPLSFTGKLYINQPFGLYETKKEKQVTLDFADVYQGQYGMSLIHRNTPAYQYKQGVLSLILAQGRPLVVGNQNYKYSIYTHKEDPFQSDAYNIAKSVNTPFILYWPEYQEKDGLQEFSFLTTDKANIVLSALYSEGDTIYARFYERSGMETNVNIDLPYLKSAECTQVKLNGEKVQEIQNVKGKVKLEFKPWEIKTLAFDAIF